MARGIGEDKAEVRVSFRGAHEVAASQVMCDVVS